MTLGSSHMFIGRGRPVNHMGHTCHRYTRRLSRQRASTQIAQSTAMPASQPAAPSPAPNEGSALVLAAVSSIVENSAIVAAPTADGHRRSRRGVLERRG
jgi:hypothetical protein